MKIQTRITCLLVILAVVFIGWFFVLKHFEQNRLEIFQKEQGQAKKDIFEQILQMKSANIDGMSKDYSIWDEMVNFVSTGDKEWAKSNVDGGLQNFKASAFWIYNLENQLVHALDDHEGPAFGEFPIAPHKVSEIFAGHPFIDFFVNTKLGLMEVQGATINNVADPKRERPKGYLLVGRLWDQKVIDDIESASGMRVKIVSEGQNTPDLHLKKSGIGEIFFTHTLDGVDKKPVARLHVLFHSDSIIRAWRISKNYFSFVVIFLLLGLIVVSSSLILWISWPLKKISLALSEENARYIDSIENNQSEMGEIARLVKRFFLQKKILSLEIQEREIAEKKFKTILESAPDAMVIVNQAGEMLIVNLQMEKMFGYKCEELLGKPIEIFLPAHLKIGHAKNVKKFFQDPTPRSMGTGLDLFGITKDGQQVPLEISLGFMKIGEDGVTIATIRNITERKEKEKALSEAFEQLRAAHDELKQTQNQLVQSEKLASIGQLAAGVAHEINNPVGFISNNMEILQEYVGNYTKILRIVENVKGQVDSGDVGKAKAAVDELKKLEEEINLEFMMGDVNKLLEHSSRGLERIRKIVLDLRTFAREDHADTMELVKIEEVIDSILSIVQSEIKSKAELTKDYGDTPLVKCNPQRLGQVFINLLVNATQAITEKGKIVIKTYQQNHYVCIDVSDTGKGIPDENLRKIFDPFFTTKPVGQGTGLGLSVSYEIVKKHGGEIKVQSKQGEGTTFTVMLPVA